MNTGQKFDSSWDRGQPIEFGLDQVIAGWTQGVPGMKIGGRRVLVIPADLAYGQNPPPGSGIEPGEPLVFVIDLVDFI
jgi:peptidylprolyl isomerase